MWLFIFFYSLILTESFYVSHWQYKTVSKHLLANPVTSDGSNYAGDITEQEALQWFDEAIVYVRGGSGGPGSNAFKFGKGRQHLGPMGGSGGNGGSVVFTVDNRVNTLLKLRGQSSYKATNGQPGDKDFANGLAGDDYIVKLPLGTVIRDNSTGEVVGELRSELDRVVVALGGLGGRGNAAMRTKGTKIVCTPPQAGEKRILKLELKLIADIGLVGVPNAGKSTLLDAITNAKPKIASYQFTTIVPNLGVCEVGGGSKFGGNSMIISDIPGLLEGAHLGVGLGRGFLRHVERCKIIIHIINGDSIDPVGDYVAINRELNLFSPELAIKPQIVVLNKIDLPHVQEKQQELLEKLKDVMPHKRLLPISAAGRIGLDELVEKSYNFLQKVKQDEEVNSSVEENAIATPTITVSWDSNTVATVYGPIITALIEEYNLIDQYYESSIRFQSLLEATGLYERLKDDYLSNFSNSFPSNGIRVNFGVQSGICLKLENGAFDVAKV